MSAAGSTGTLARGLDVLALFGHLAPELSQREISEQLSIPLPTVHRLTKVLTDHRFLARDERTRRYRLGLEVARLLPSMLTGMRLPDLAREHLRALADATGETVNLAILDRGEVAYLDSAAGTHLLTLQSPVGLRLPAHCTALGKCMLAQAADEEARRLVGDTPYQARTPHTLTSWPRLRASLEEVRTTGVAISEQEYEIGLDSIAVALAWPQENAAINISLPTQLDTPQARRALVQGLRRTARAIIPPHA